MSSRPGRSRTTQRARILDALVVSIDEQGFIQTTVGGVCARAKVSRVTFYEAFDGLEECLLTAMDEVYGRVDALVAQAFAAAERWQDGIRAALALLLAFFDGQPQLARMCFVEVLAAGSWALERRERHLRTLTATIVERWPLPDGGEVNPLAAAGVMEALLGILHRQLLYDSEEPLIGLLGPLMGLVTAPYLDRRGVEEEMERGSCLAQVVLAAHASCSPEDDGVEIQIPDLLSDRRASRARDCLRRLAEHPGASNRQIAAAVGIARDTHISTLLARLHRMGLIVKLDKRPGGPNAWSLSSRGYEVVGALQAGREHQPHVSDNQLQGRA